MKIKDVVVEGIFDYFTSSAVVDKGYKEFTKLLRDNNIDVDNPGPAIAGKLPDYLKQWTVNYMSGGERRGEQPAIIAKIQAIPIPRTINTATIRQYIKAATEARAQAKEETATGLPALANNKPAAPAPATPVQQAARPQTTPARAPESAGGVTLIRTAGRTADGQPTPTIVTYKKQQYALMDDGRWLNVINGKAVNTALASFLQTELESIS